MSIYEVGKLPGRRKSAPVRMAVEAGDSGLYRLRGAADLALHGPAAYRRQDTLGQRLVAAFAAVGRLVLPVLMLLAALAAMYLYLDTPSPFQIGAVPAPNGTALTVSHLLLPVAFFVVALTNRRYGPGCAFAQVMLASVLALGAIILAGDTLRATLPAADQPDSRMVMAFVAAFIAANLASIVVFDGARGPKWWSAPLLGSLAASIVYSVVFGFAAYAGTPGPWPGLVIDYFGVLVASSVALLVPYWCLRGLVPPLSGFGGY